MEIILAVYLVVAGVLAAGNKEGIIKDDNAIETYKFEAYSSRLSGDITKAEFCEARVEELKNGK